MKLYAILGLPDGASIQEVKQQYRKLALQHHPDRGDGDANQFQEINAAYAILSNEDKKREYDAFGDDGEPIQMFGGNRCSRFPHAMSTEVEGQAAMYIPGFGTFLANGERTNQEGGPHPYADGPKYTAAEIQHLCPPPAMLKDSSVVKPRRNSRNSIAGRRNSRGFRFSQERVINGKKAMFLPGFGTFLANGERAHSGDEAYFSPRSPVSDSSQAYESVAEGKGEPSVGGDCSDLKVVPDKVSGRHSPKPGRSPKPSPSSRRRSQRGSQDANAILKQAADAGAGGEQPTEKIEDKGTAMFLPGFGTFFANGERTNDPDEIPASPLMPAMDAKAPKLLFPAVSHHQSRRGTKSSSCARRRSTHHSVPTSPIDTQTDEQLYAREPTAVHEEDEEEAEESPSSPLGELATELFDTENGSIAALHDYRMQNNVARAMKVEKFRHSKEEERVRAIQALENRGVTWTLDAITESPGAIPSLLWCLADQCSTYTKGVVSDFLIRLARDHGFRLLSDTPIISLLLNFIDEFVGDAQRCQVLEQVINCLSQLIRLAPGAKQYHTSGGTNQLLRILKLPMQNTGTPTQSPSLDSLAVFSDGFSGGFSQGTTEGAPCPHRPFLPSGYPGNHLDGLGLEALVNGWSAPLEVSFTSSPRQSAEEMDGEAWLAQPTITIAVLRTLRHLVARSIEAYHQTVACIPILVQRLDTLSQTTSADFPVDEVIDALGDLITDMVTAAFHPVQHLLPVLTNVYSLLHGTTCRRTPYIATCLLHLLWSTYENTPRHLRPPKLVLRMAMVGKVLDLIQQPPVENPKDHLWAISLLLCWSRMGEVRPTKRYCDAVAAAIRCSEFDVQISLQAVRVVQHIAYTGSCDPAYAAELAPNVQVIGTALTELFSGPFGADESVARSAVNAIIALVATRELQDNLRDCGMLVRRRVPSQRPCGNVTPGFLQGPFEGP